MDVSSQPFPVALSSLMADEDLSARQLAKRTRRRSAWGSGTTIDHLLNRKMKPSRRALETISAALNVSPDYFAEYRLLKARDLLDPEEVGLERALRNLERCPDLART
jgi:transcriptional regulator with XRE-family HTH domain